MDKNERFNYEKSVLKEQANWVYPIIQARDGKAIALVGGKGVHAIHQMIDRHIADYIQDGQVDFNGLIALLRDKYPDIQTERQIQDLEDVARDKCKLYFAK